MKHKSEQRSCVNVLCASWATLFCDLTVQSDPPLVCSFVSTGVSAMREVHSWHMWYNTLSRFAQEPVYCE